MGNRKNLYTVQKAGQERTQKDQKLVATAMDFKLVQLSHIIYVYYVHRYL